MKKTTITIIGLVMLFMIACKQKPNSTTSGTSNALEQNSNLTPLQIVNERMNLFNEHNFNAFLKLYNKDVKVYTYPDKLMGTGSDRLASIFKSNFENKSVAVKVVNQISNGSYVINHELVTNDGKETKYVSIYKVENGLITSVSFVREF